MVRGRVKGSKIREKLTFLIFHVILAKSFIFLNSLWDVLHSNKRVFVIFGASLRRQQIGDGSFCTVTPRFFLIVRVS